MDQTIFSRGCTTRHKSLTNTITAKYQKQEMEARNDTLTLATGALLLQVKKSILVGLFMTLLLLVSVQRGQAWTSVGSLLSRAPSKAQRLQSQKALKYRNNMRLQRAFTAAASSSLLQSTAATDISSSTSFKYENQIAPNRDGVTKILADDPQFIKPDPDRREYRWIQLANNLQVLLVSTTKSTTVDCTDEEVSHVEAAAVHVQAGHFDDTIPGVSTEKVYIRHCQKASCHLIDSSLSFSSLHTLMSTCSSWVPKSIQKKMPMKCF